MSDWFKERKYLHFDLPLSDKDKSEVIEFVKNPDNIKKHSFYPFISYLAIKYKIKEDETSGIRYLDDTGTRPISYAAHLDAQVYSYYSHILTQLYESKIRHLKLSENVIAFRKIIDTQSGESKSNIHLARDAFSIISKKKSCVVYAFDIKSFFDNLNSAVLKQKWEKTLGTHRLPDDHFAVFKSVTKFSVVMRDDVYKVFDIHSDAKKKGINKICSPEKFRELVRSHNKIIDENGNEKRGLITTKNLGIPQGSPISAILANIYMLDFDEKLNQKIKSLNGEYLRYCDDILCIVPSENEFPCEQFVNSLVKEIGLELNSKKTEIRRFSEGPEGLVCDKPVQYLGFFFDGKKAWIRTSSLSRYLRKAKKAIHLAKQTQIKYNIIRTSKGQKEELLYKKKLLERYSHVGKSNFITYGLRASKTLNSPTIRRQMKKMQNILHKEINLP